jgi:hypothetical protein
MLGTSSAHFELLDQFTGVIMQQKNKKHQQEQHQRSSKPDEFLMICERNPTFGQKFAEIFRGLQKGKQHHE